MSSHSSHDATLTIEINQTSEQISSNPPTSLTFELESVRPDFGFAKITASAELVEKLLNETARSQQQSVLTQGFNRGQVPIEYIKQNYKENLVEHIKELLIKYCIVNYLYEQLRANKIVIGGNPRLKDIFLEPNQDALFIFELSIFPDLTIYEWKYFPFKAPKRKNYKDIDRQVQHFIEEERNKSETTHKSTISMGDWVNFELQFLDNKEEPIFNGLNQNFWFKLGEDDTESPLRNVFSDHKVGDVFCTNHESIQEYLSNQIDTSYSFCIKINDVLPYTHFDFDQFKQMFRIKTNKDMNRKLIEVFSYRNDLSQRRAMVEEALRVLLSKHKFNIPNHIILRHQKSLLENIQLNPDYNVYRVQKNFQDYIRNLAKKQMTEMIFIDKLAYSENISITNDDVKGYLNLINRPRMKEFIYFQLPSFKIQGQEVPIPTEELKRTCLREKAINYVIYHLTKK